MKRFSLILAVLVMFFSLLSIAFAQDVNRKGACRADYQKFCKGVQPGQGRIAECMQQHENELSFGCREHIAAVRERAQDFVKACGDDAKTLCQGVRPGKGRVLACLKENELKLSPPCSAYFKK